MPRVSRKLSRTGIYHVMLRGNERRKIFIDDEDRKKFIDTLCEKSKRDELIRYLKDNSTLSIREIADVLGINRGIVQRA